MINKEIEVEEHIIFELNVGHDLVIEKMKAMGYANLNAYLPRIQLYKKRGSRDMAQYNLETVIKEINSERTDSEPKIITTLVIPRYS